MGNHEGDSIYSSSTLYTLSSKTSLDMEGRAARTHVGTLVS